MKNLCGILKSGLTLIGLYALSLSTALAQEDNCAAIDRVLESVSIIRAIQSDPKGRFYEKNIVQLNQLSTQINMPTGLNRDLADVNSAPISNYIDTLNAAMIIAENGETLDARQILIDNIKPEFISAVQVFENQWNCRERAVSEESQQKKGSGDFTSANAAILKDASGQGANNIARDSQSQGALGNSRILQESKIGRRAQFELTTPYMLLGGLFVLGLILYMLQRRSKGFKARQKRRILNTPVRMRLNNTDSLILLVDISRNGVKVQHNGTLDMQKKVNLHINGQWHSGHIIWRNDSFAGVKFKKPMKAPTFNAFVDAVLSNKGAVA